MMLTPRALEILGIMSETEEEFVAEGIQCWVGEVQVSRGSLRQLLRCLALKDVSDQSGIERYVISDIGRSIVERPDLAEEVATAVLLGRPFTVSNGAVLELSMDGAEPFVNHLGR